MASSLGRQGRRWSSRTEAYIAQAKRIFIPLSHSPRPPTTRSTRSAQSLHPGLRSWRELCRCRCHHGNCRENFSARASCRCRSEGILAAPAQQQPTLAGARNRSTTCFSARIGEWAGQKQNQQFYNRLAPMCAGCGSRLAGPRPNWRRSLRWSCRRSKNGKRAKSTCPWRPWPGS